MTPAERLIDAAGNMLMIGAGNMGGAMLRRWLAVGLPAEAVTVVSPSGRTMPAGVRVVPLVPDAAFDTIVLACKPQQLATVAPSMRGKGRRFVLSILAGVELATLETLLGVPIIRAMPNLPVAIGKGVVALHGDRGAAGALAQSLAEPLGLVEWIEDEKLFHLVSALAASGPAFLYRFIDALAAAGASLGLPADQSARLALATVEGSALLAAGADASPMTLADQVASPGGMTRAGLDVLDEEPALIRLMTDTLAAATRRSSEMAAAARGSSV